MNHPTVIPKNTEWNSSQVVSVVKDVFNMTDDYIHVHNSTVTIYRSLSAVEKTVVASRLGSVSFVELDTGATHVVPA